MRAARTCSQSVLGIVLETILMNHTFCQHKDTDNMKNEVKKKETMSALTILCGKVLT